MDHESRLKDHESRITDRELCKNCGETVSTMIYPRKLGNSQENGEGLTIYIKNDGKLGKIDPLYNLTLLSRKAQGPCFKFPVSNFSYETFFRDVSPFLR